MRIRIIAVIAAVILAAVGAVVLVIAVQNAGRQSAAESHLTSVLVVKSEIPAGTPASSLGSAVAVESVPSAYIADGAVGSVSALGGRVSAVKLEPGEQVLASRFVTPEALSASGGTVPVPKGMQEVSVAVELQRIAGGRVGAGGHVGIFNSLDGSGNQPASTRLLLDQALVVSIASTAPASGASTTGGSSAATSGTVLVTVALSADDAQKLIYAAQFGHIWMSVETADSSPVTTGPVTRAEVAG